MVESVVETADLARWARLSRIRFFSLMLGRCCVVLAALLTLGLLFYWLTASTASIATGAQIPLEWLTRLGAGRRAAGFAISFAPLSCLILALMAARRCFGAFAVGNFFGPDAIKGLRNFALGLLASALLKPFSAAALSVLLSWDAPAGQHRLTFGFGSDTMLTLLAAGIIAVIAWVMTEASVLAEENAQFI
ncbi:DUF2975 domain-containing protein [Mesorhizobium sp. STM 4661]|uniref:DUF2975 domain-containing protein n=1 Tax=Mesorhizobium sp. STM 4661 TaxID=1297570 RepID=UPI0002BF0723|nr:DUF2975 domain-containing protein [Mesorhizobium sp. STM 4661]CCV13516.1 conserved membrane hypothetical protein [Mesorhizobium sp. STM 4661]